MVGDPDLLWSPSHPETSQTSLFRQHINSKYDLSLHSYEELWRWSCDNRADFWSEVWDWEGVIGTKGSPPYTDESVPPGANPPWFPGAYLNWAENQLRHAKTYPHDIAIIQTSEPCPGWEPPTLRVTQKELRELVGKCQEGMRAAGLGKGDRVAFWGGTCLEAVVVLLATSSLGGIFSSAAADFGVDGVIERLEQVNINPTAARAVALTDVFLIVDSSKAFIRHQRRSLRSHPTSTAHVAPYPVVILDGSTCTYHHHSSPSHCHMPHPFRPLLLDHRNMGRFHDQRDSRT